MLNEETPSSECECAVCGKRFFSDNKRRIVCNVCKAPKTKEEAEEAKIAKF